MRFGSWAQSRFVRPFGQQHRPSCLKLLTIESWICSTKFFDNLSTSLNLTLDEADLSLVCNCKGSKFENGLIVKLQKTFSAHKVFHLSNANNFDNETWSENVLTMPPDYKYKTKEWSSCAMDHESIDHSEVRESCNKKSALWQCFFPNWKLKTFFLFSYQADEQYSFRCRTVPVARLREKGTKGNSLGLSANVLNLCKLRSIWWHCSCWTHFSKYIATFTRKVAPNQKLYRYIQ